MDCTNIDSWMSEASALEEDIAILEKKLEFRIKSIERELARIVIEDKLLQKNAWRAYQKTITCLTAKKSDNEELAGLIQKYDFMCDEIVFNVGDDFFMVCVSEEKIYLHACTPDGDLEIADKSGLERLVSVFELKTFVVEQDRVSGIENEMRDVFMEDCERN